MSEKVPIYVDIDECIEAVRCLNPEEVFNEKDLELWAEENGWKKEE